jgi:phosphatidylinositol glycan class M
MTLKQQKKKMKLRSSSKSKSIQQQQQHHHHHHSKSPSSKPIINNTTTNYNLENYLNSFLQNLTITTRNFYASCISSMILRILLILYGTWQDQYFRVKYSDIDYFVTTDGAKRVVEGRSPYERTTYRYSPLLAWSLIPNILIHPSCGKFMFVLFDLFTAIAIYHIGLIRWCWRQEKDNKLTINSAKIACLTWLWNPIALGISTRGSSDSIVCLLVCITIWGLLLSTSNNYYLLISAIIHGFSVHWRLYPIIFAPTILVFLNTWPKRISYGIISASTFFGLGLLSYYFYGFEFLQETFLYHLTRTDHRHNFSIWFYSLYLSFNKPSGFMMSMAAFLPQVLVQAILIWKFAKQDVLFCFCLQTMAFVCFNKVITAQYFLWFICLLPQALERVDVSKISMLLKGVLPWLIAELSWLFWAYRIEFLGEDDFLLVWIFGIVFFVINIGSMMNMIMLYR